ncbi:hypothetical protein E2C01_002440 [Portunus trituberculatus]|uniref:Uncharacterized protein n=1 Tax=Portunus trituberculatus TaxID=210409 RepID=A0A5B7CJD9_PORTR|nr:hypothetical protein [Portunus trituberculatus]
MHRTISVRLSNSTWQATTPGSTGSHSLHHFHTLPHYRDRVPGGKLQPATMQTPAWIKRFWADFLHKEFMPIKILFFLMYGGVPTWIPVGMSIKSSIILTLLYTSTSRHLHTRQA